jgi:hypothetical protein
MSVDWVHFTPATALLGGALIGALAGLMALVGGKIAGMGGIFGVGLLLSGMTDSAKSSTFLISLDPA